MLDVDRVHVKVLVLVLAEELSLTLCASAGEVVGCGSRVGCVAVIAIGREHVGEDAADEGSEER